MVQIIVMKKMTVCVLGNLFGSCFPFIDTLEYLEVISIFHFTPAFHSEVCKLRLVEGKCIEDVQKDVPDGLMVLRNDGQDYTCLIQGNISDEVSRFVGQFDLKLEFPIIFDGDKCKLSLVGTPDEMQNIIMAAKENGWTLKILSVEQYDPHISSALNMLTEKQSAILQLAYRSGYFDRPRKITAEKLARKVGLHKSTLLEHLHKAQKRVIGNVIEQSG